VCPDELSIANNDESVFENTTQVGFRYENWKCIAGILQDPHYYYESTRDAMNSTDKGYTHSLHTKKAFLSICTKKKKKNV
jgi:hypothetical protein